VVKSRFLSLTLSLDLLVALEAMDRPPFLTDQSSNLFHKLIATIELVHEQAEAGTGRRKQDRVARPSQTDCVSDGLGHGIDQDDLAAKTDCPE